MTPTIEEINNEECFQGINVFPDGKGRIRGIGFKSINGLVSVLRRADKNCKRYGYKTRIMIDLPVEKNQEKEYRFISKKKSV